MFYCGKTLIALALVMAIPVAGSAQTADKPAAPQAQPASQTPPNAEPLKPQQLEALVAPIIRSALDGRGECRSRLLGGATTRIRVGPSIDGKVA